jgi:hypothetical protein
MAVIDGQRKFAGFQSKRGNYPRVGSTAARARPPIATPSAGAERGVTTWLTNNTNNAPNPY